MLGYLSVYPGSAVFYLLLVLICYLLARAAEESGKCQPLICAAALLAIVSAIRSPLVGVDTFSYATAYFGEIPLYFEPGFTWLIKLFKPLHNLSYFLGFIAIVMYGFTFARLWQLRRYCSLSLSVAAYMLTIFPSTWNGLRSCLVTAIMFYAFGLIEKQKYIPFIATVGLCCTIHYSSVAFLLLFLAVPKWMQGVGKNKRVLINLLLPIIVVFTAGAVLWMTSIGLFDRYGKEYSNDVATNRIGLSWYLFFILVAASWFEIRCESKKSEEFERSFTYLAFVTLGIAFFLSGLFWFGGGRLSSYFIIYSILIFSRFWTVSKTTRYGLFFRFGIALYCCYAFFQVLSSNGQALMPYMLS